MLQELKFNIHLNAKAIQKKRDKMKRLEGENENRN